jgi:hypothetical protein
MSSSGLPAGPLDRLHSRYGHGVHSPHEKGLASHSKPEWNNSKSADARVAEIASLLMGMISRDGIIGYGVNGPQIARE